MKLPEFLNLDGGDISAEDAADLNRDLATKTLSDIGPDDRQKVLDYLLVAMQHDSVEFDLRGVPFIETWYQQSYRQHSLPASVPIYRGRSLPRSRKTFTTARPGNSCFCRWDSRLIGQNDAGISFCQSLVLLVWNRVILPSGKSIVLERQPGADVEGYAELEDQVDYHWGNIFKAALVSTLLGVGANLGSSDGDSEIVQALRQSTSENASSTSPP